jgi:N-acetylneuraminic acid mutarotase
VRNVLVVAVGVAASAPSCASTSPGAGPPLAANPGAWTTARATPAPRFEGHAATAGGRVYYLGGIVDPDGVDADATESEEVDVYDPANDTWTVGPPLPADAPKHHLAVAAMGDRVYVLCGFTGILGSGPNHLGTFAPNGHAYVLEAGAWRRLADQPIARGAATAEALNGVIYVAGGGPGDTDGVADLLAYDPTVDAWTRRASMPTARQHLASCATSAGMLVVGGWTGADQHVSTAAELYDPAADSWTSVADLPTARGGLGAVLSGNACHVLGGETWAGPAPGTFAVHEGFDMTTRTWSAYAPMPSARHGIGVATLGDAIWVIGGGPTRGNSYTDEVDRWAPNP